MKKIAVLLMSLFTLASCEFDDSEIWDKLYDHENRIQTLEMTCRQMNTNIESLQIIISALQQNDYVTGVAPIMEGNTVIGYTILFSKSGSVTVYHGQDGVDGSDGKDGADGAPGQDGSDGQDGQTPVIGVRQDTDGVYYWTLNGEWLLDDYGNKIPTTGKDGADGSDGKDGVDGASGSNGVTPELKIEDEYWYVSYDGGSTWVKLGKAVGADGKDGDSFFQDIQVSADGVLLVLSDGTELLLTRKPVDVNSISLVSVTSNSAIFAGVVTPMSPDFEVGVIYSKDPDVKVQKSQSVSSYDFPDGVVNLVIDNLEWNTKYYYRIYFYHNGMYTYGEVQSLCTLASLLNKDYINLSQNGTSNSYIVSKSGIYSFNTVKGNSSESVGNVSEAVVLWETFGSDLKPEEGDLVASVACEGDKVAFATNKEFKEGNAVIAVKDINGQILWSWHLWFVEDEIKEHEYANDAGIMMDRNLGALSATPGDSKAFGLKYQWGRKDPFPGNRNIYDGTLSMVTTGIWPPSVLSDADCGTIKYSIENPMTIIDGSYDWLYTGSDWFDNTRWASDKTIYDPCPPGWRVPDGGKNGIWAKAGFDSWDSDAEKMGFMFPSRWCGEQAWYQACGNALNLWSVTPRNPPYDSDIYSLFIWVDSHRTVRPTSTASWRDMPIEIRCVREDEDLVTGITGIEKGHEWVDLGLPSGVKWATCNVGATVPSGYGTLYSWAETSPKINYAMSSYFLAVMTPYGCTFNPLGLGNISGTEYDAATENWGGKWRMPSETEFDELMEKCERKWTEVSGVAGYEFVGPNGNSIFLPASGYTRDDYSDNSYQGTIGAYWTANAVNTINAIYLFFTDSSLYFSADESGYTKAMGLTIRPIISGN